MASTRRVTSGFSLLFYSSGPARSLLLVSLMKRPRVIAQSVEDQQRSFFARLNRPAAFGSGKKEEGAPSLTPGNVLLRLGSARVPAAGLDGSLPPCLQPSGRSRRAAALPGSRATGPAMRRALALEAAVVSPRRREVASGRRSRQSRSTCPYHGSASPTRSGEAWQRTQQQP